MEQDNSGSKKNVLIFNRILQNRKLRNNKSLDKKYFKFSVYSRIKKRIRKVYEYGKDIIKGISGINLGFNNLDIKHSQEQKQNEEQKNHINLLKRDTYQGQSNKYDLQIHSDFGDFDLSSIHPSVQSEATNKSLNINNLLENRKGQQTNDVLKSIQESNEEEYQQEGKSKFQNIRIKKLDDSQHEISEIRNKRIDRQQSLNASLIELNREKEIKNEATQTTVDFDENISFKNGQLYDIISQIPSNNEKKNEQNQPILFKNLIQNQNSTVELSKSKQELKRRIKEMTQQIFINDLSNQIQVIENDNYTCELLIKKQNNSHRETIHQSQLEKEQLEQELEQKLQDEKKALMERIRSQDNFIKQQYDYIKQIQDKNVIFDQSTKQSSKSKNEIIDKEQNFQEKINIKYLGKFNSSPKNKQQKSSEQNKKLEENNIFKDKQENVSIFVSNIKEKIELQDDQQPQDKKKNEQEQIKDSNEQKVNVNLFEQKKENIKENQNTSLNLFEQKQEKTDENKQPSLNLFEQKKDNPNENKISSVNLFEQKKENADENKISSVNLFEQKKENADEIKQKNDLDLIQIKTDNNISKNPFSMGNNKNIISLDNNDVINNLFQKPIQQQQHSFDNKNLFQNDKQIDSFNPQQNKDDKNKSSNNLQIFGNNNNNQNNINNSIDIFSNTQNHSNMNQINIMNNNQSTSNNNFDNMQNNNMNIFNQNSTQNNLNSFNFQSNNNQQNNVFQINDGNNQQQQGGPFNNNQSNMNQNIFNGNNNVQQLFSYEQDNQDQQQNQGQQQNQQMQGIFSNNNDQQQEQQQQPQQQGNKYNKRIEKRLMEKLSNKNNQQRLN